MRDIDVWGRWIARCHGIRKWWQRQWCTIWSVSLLQEVIRYAVKQYLYKIGKTAYLKIFTYIIEMMYHIHSSRRRSVSSVWLSWLCQDQLNEELEVECHCRA
jgi:hypothetical protein